MATLCSLADEVFGVQLPAHSTEPQPTSVTESGGVSWNNWDTFFNSKHYDPMHRLPASYEVYSLAECTVSLSDWLNWLWRLPGEPHYVDDIKRAEETYGDVEDTVSIGCRQPSSLNSTPEDALGERWVKKFIGLCYVSFFTACTVFQAIFYNCLLPYLRTRHPRFRYGTLNEQFLVLHNLHLQKNSLLWVLMQYHQAFLVINYLCVFSSSPSCMNPVHILLNEYVNSYVFISFENLGSLTERLLPIFFVAQLPAGNMSEIYLCFLFPG